MYLSEKEISSYVKNKAKELGFAACGISKIEPLIKEGQYLREWLNKGNHAGMSYMENHFEKRINPSKLVEGAESVISVLLNYKPAQKQNASVPVFSKYAYGKDYHIVVKEKLKTLYDSVEKIIPNFEGRIFTDSAPVMDKVWAQKSGLGWIGKSTNLITKKGTFFFIGEIICNAKFEYDTTANQLCGTCTRCIDACPTKAIEQPYVLNANKCISYQTIENKDEIPVSLYGKFQNRVLGCDICMDVCPWNSRAETTNVEEFSPKEEFINMSTEDWYALNEKDFSKLFSKTAVKRAKYKGLMRNLKFIKNG